MKENNFSLFIPMYNVDKHIESVINGIPADALERIRFVLLIDNGSSDNTLHVVRSLLNKKKDHRFQLFKNAKNYYLGGSTIIALQKSIEAGCDFMICLHGDGQANPKDLSKFIELANPELDFVFGSRLESGSEVHDYSKLRILGNKFFALLQKTILGANINDIGAYISFNLHSIRKIEYWRVPHDMSYQPLLVLLIGKIKPISALEFPISWGRAETSNINIITYGIKHFLRLVRIRFFSFPFTQANLNDFQSEQL